MPNDWPQETRPMRMPTRDDVLDSFSIEEDPAAVLLRYQMKFPQWADDLAELVQAFAEIDPEAEFVELTPEEEAEQAAFVEESWKRFQAKRALAKAFPIEVPAEFAFVQQGAKVRHKELGDGVIYGTPRRVAETGEWICLAHGEGSEELRWVTCSNLEAR